MAGKTKLVFDIDGLYHYIRDFYTDRFLDVQFLVLFESDYSESGYIPIDIIKYSDSKTRIETERASENFIDKFYKIRLYKDFVLKKELLDLKNKVSESDFQELIKSKDPIELYDFDINWVFELKKLIPDVITNIIDETRSWIGDLNLDDPAFTDDQYKQMIKFALLQLKGHTNLMKIKDEDIFLIQLLVRESIALNISHDYAKYYKLSSPGAELDKSEISRHYIEVSRNIRDQFNSYASRLNLHSGGYDEIGIINQMPSYDINFTRKKSQIYNVYEWGNVSFPNEFILMRSKSFYSENSNIFKRFNR
jgi:hypothetical protein